MPRRQPALLPVAPALREEDEGTWMLTFSDLVLLLLAFVAIGMLMERGSGPHVVGAPRQAQAPPASASPSIEPFTLIAHAVPAPSLGGEQLRALAARLETRIAAEGIPGLRPIRIGSAGITLEIGPAAATADVVPPLPVLVPDVPIVVATQPIAGSSPHARALARTARLAHELVAGDPLLAVRTVAATDDGPARIEIRRAG